jgi:hypothetical protein
MAHVAKYTRQLSALINDSQRDRLDALAESRHVGVSEVLRDVLEAGLPIVERVAPSPVAAPSWTQALTTAMRDGE